MTCARPPAGFPELSSVNQLVRHYLGSVVEGSERWMTANRATGRRHDRQRAQRRTLQELALLASRRSGLGTNSYLNRAVDTAYAPDAYVASD